MNSLLQTLYHIPAFRQVSFCLLMLFVYLFVCLFVGWFVCLFAYLFICLLIFRFENTSFASLSSGWSFFHHTFPKAVYSMPTENVTDIERNIPVALQRLFFRMQTSDEAADTTMLTQSFGWDSVDSFMQHDVQEVSDERRLGLSGLVPQSFVVVNSLL
jgi:hypothetical protein